MMPPSPQLKSASNAKPMPKLKESSTSADGPIDLCCPITLEFFKDPVKTIHGQTYERSAIEDWLLTKNIDQ